MSKTQIGSGRIQNGSIELKHLSPGLKLNESYIDFEIRPHDHKNKKAIDILTNSTPESVSTLDLADVATAILEVVNARDTNNTLRETILARALKADVDDLLLQFDEAKQGYPTLAEYIEEVKMDATRELLRHSGAISHKQLDSMYQEVVAARGDCDTLTDRLSNVGTGTGDGEIIINSLTPWVFDYTLKAGETKVELPNTYSPAKSALQVFEGPLLLLSQVDYLEDSPSTITFINAFDTDVELRIIGVNTGRLFEWEYRFLGDGEEEMIKLNSSYRPNFKELQVYEDGLLLREDDDYIEVSEHMIRFVQPICLGSTISIYKRRW